MPFVPDWPLFADGETVRCARLLERLKFLNHFHRDNCESYRKIVDVMPEKWGDSSLEKLPWLSVRLFKTFDLVSVPATSITRVITSSGTSGSSVSRVSVDRDTGLVQQRVLIKTLEEVVGRKRLPLGLVEARRDLNSGQITAQVAGSVGVSLFGRTVDLLQSDQENWDLDKLDSLAEKATREPVLIFGFTFNIWKLLEFIDLAGWRGSFNGNAILLHTGGWKKLEALSVSNSAFKANVERRLGISRVHNFYGMAEQVGSIFLECSQGYLHCSSYNHVIVREPRTWAPARQGEVGIVQVLSALPESYPGHSLLTEDLGRLVGTEDCSCGWKGPYFEILGRVPRMENKGCSNV